MNFQIYFCLAFAICSGSASGSSRATQTGRTSRYWDCCKPSCSWPGKAPVNKPVNICAKNGVKILKNQNTKSGCEGGSAFVCNNYQPFVVKNVAYGFATVGIPGKGAGEICCACYEMTFTSGSVNGQKMIIQAISDAEDLADKSHFDLLIPGGGIGEHNGCKPQWGAPDNGWGEKYGGVNTLKECNQLPVEIREGCKFRFGWFKNAENPRVSFKPVTCPKALTDRSGCIRSD